MLARARFAVAVVAIVGSSRGVRADDPSSSAPVVSPAASPIVSADDARARAVDEALRADATTSRRWYFGWTAIFGVATVGTGAYWAASHSHNARVDGAIGTILNGLGLVTTIFVPPPSMGDDPADPRDVRQRRFDTTADVEALGRSWLAHAGGVAANGVAGLYLWRHEHRAGDAAATFLGGTLVSEVKIWTQPTRARDTRDLLSQISIAPIVTTSTGLLFVTARF